MQKGTIPLKYKQATIHYRTWTNSFLQGTYSLTNADYLNLALVLAPYLLLLRFLLANSLGLCLHSKIGTVVWPSTIISCLLSIQYLLMSSWLIFMVLLTSLWRSVGSIKGVGWRMEMYLKAGACQRLTGFMLRIRFSDVLNIRLVFKLINKTLKDYIKWLTLKLGMGIGKKDLPCVFTVQRWTNKFSWRLSERESDKNYSVEV